MENNGMASEDEDGNNDSSEESSYRQSEASSDEEKVDEDSDEDYEISDSSSWDELNRALLVAASKAPLETFKKIIEAGADPCCDSQEETCLRRAIQRKRYDIAKWLVSGDHMKEIISSREDTLQHVAVDLDDVEMLRYALERNEPQDPNIETFREPLFDAAMFGKYKCAKFLLEYGCDVNANGENKYTIFPSTALQQAAASGDEKMIDLLLAHGANRLVVHVDGNKRPHMPWTELDKDHLHILPKLMNKELMNETLKDEIDSNFKDKYVVQIACELGIEEHVKYLLELGADFTVQDKYNRGVLYSAATYGNTQIIELLTNMGVKGLDANARSTYDNRTPLTMALANLRRLEWDKQEALLAALFRAGAVFDNIAWPDKPHLLDWLLRHGANPDFYTDSCDSAIHLMSSYTLLSNQINDDDQNLLKKLLAANVDLALSAIPARHTRTPLQDACIACEPAIVKYMVYAGFSFKHLFPWLTDDLAEPKYPLERMREDPEMKVIIKWLQQINNRGPTLKVLCRRPILMTLGHQDVDKKIDQLIIPEMLKDFLKPLKYLEQNIQKYIDKMTF